MQVDLYRYANKGASSSGFLAHLLYDQYEIIDEPPLSFRFPDAYYHDHPNHKGGAQNTVALHFDLDTMKPAPLAPIVFPGPVLVDAAIAPNKYRERTPQEAADYARRYVNVTIYSNATGGSGGAKFPKSETLSSRAKDYLIRGEDGAKDAGIVNNMQIINYTEKYKNYTNLRTDPPVYVGNVDIENNDISAFPLDSTKSIVKVVDCDRLSNICAGQFIYHNRELNFYVSNKHLLEIELVAQKIVQLLDKHRLPPARKGEY